MLFDLREQIAKSLQCPDCSIDMDFLASLRTNAYCIDDLRARVLSLSELPAPQPSTRGDAANSIMGQAAQWVNTGNAEPGGILQNNRTEAS